MEYNPNLPPARFLSATEASERSERDMQREREEDMSDDGALSAFAGPQKRPVDAEARRDDQSTDSALTKQQEPRSGTSKRVNMQAKDGSTPKWLLPVAMDYDDGRGIAEWNGAVNTHWRDMLDMASSSDGDERDGGAVSIVPSIIFHST